MKDVLSPKRRPGTRADSKKPSKNRNAMMAPKFLTPIMPKRVQAHCIQCQIWFGDLAGQPQGPLLRNMLVLILDRRDSAERCVPLWEHQSNNPMLGVSASVPNRAVCMRSISRNRKSVYAVKSQLSVRTRQKRHDTPMTHRHTPRELLSN